MKTSFEKFLAVIVACGALSGGAFADDGERTYNWPKAATVENRADLCGSTTLLGFDITDLEKEDVAEIKDMILHPKSGRVLAVTVTHDEVDGKYLLLPTSAFKCKRNADDYSIEAIHFVSSTDVMSAPRMNVDFWTKNYDREFLERLCNQAKIEPEQICGEHADKDVHRSMRDWGLVLASELIGKDVYNTDNKDIGEIDNLLIKFDKGILAYGIVGMGGLLGVAEDDRAVKWSLLTCSVRDDQKLVFVAREENTN